MRRSGVPGRRTHRTIPNTITAAARMPNAIQPHCARLLLRRRCRGADDAAPPGVTPDPVVVASRRHLTVVTVIGGLRCRASAVVVSVVVSAVVGLGRRLFSVEVVVVVSAATRPAAPSPCRLAGAWVPPREAQGRWVQPSPTPTAASLRPASDLVCAVAVDHRSSALSSRALRRSRRSARDGGLDSRGSPLLTLS
jgi:hypothetical protein